MSNLAGSIAVAALVSIAAPGAAQVPPEARAAGFGKLVFAEDFSNFDVGWDGTGAHRWYPMKSLGKPVGREMSGRTGDAFRMRTPPDPKRGANTSFVTFSAGQGATSTSFGFGYYEGRLRFRPDVNNWNSFWLVGDGPLIRPGKPTTGCEIDIAESMGPIGPRVYGGTVHEWRQGKATHNKNALIHLPDGAELSQWNRFGMLWTKTRITWFLNGKPISSAPTPAACKSARLHLIFGAAKFGGVEDQALDMSWIRVYR